VELIWSTLLEQVSGRLLFKARAPVRADVLYDTQISYGDAEHRFYFAVPERFH
jgi:hypothetical protein